MQNVICIISSKDGVVEALLTPSAVIVRLSENESARFGQVLQNARDGIKNDGIVKKLLVNTALFMVDFFKKKNNRYEIASIRLEKIAEIRQLPGNFDLISPDGKSLTDGRKYDFDLNDQQPAYKFRYSMSQTDVFADDDIQKFIGCFNELKPKHAAYLKAIETK